MEGFTTNRDGWRQEHSREKEWHEQKGLSFSFGLENSEEPNLALKQKNSNGGSRRGGWERHLGP